MSNLINWKHTYVANGGNTVTTLNPTGRRAKDADNVPMLLSKGEPPPPRVPGGGEFPTACPLCWKFISDIIIDMPAIPIIPAPNAPAAWAAAAIASSTADSVVD